MKYYLDMVVIATSDQTKAALGRWLGFSDYRGEDNAFMSLPRCGAIKGCRPALSECKETSATDAKGHPLSTIRLRNRCISLSPTSTLLLYQFPGSLLVGISATEQLLTS